VALRSLYAICDELRHRARLRHGDSDAAWGRHAEDLAHRHLQSLGMTVVERNWVSPAGREEIDLIAWDGDTLVFVEVKSRHDVEYGDPERALDRAKFRHVCTAARHFLDAWHLPPERARFDLVTVVFEPFEIRYTPNAWGWADGD
jgi:putative endonuclease